MKILIVVLAGIGAAEAGRWAVDHVGSIERPAAVACQDELQMRRRASAEAAPSVRLIDV